MINDKIVIRPYGIEENLGGAFFTLAETAFTYGAPWSKAQYEQTISRADLSFFIAEYNDELIGYVGGKLMVDEAEIYSIAVAHPYKNKKVATRLIKVFKEYCNYNGIDTLFLEVRESNTSARYFYQTHDFIEIDKRKNYYTQPVEDAVIMKCSLRK